MSRKILLLTLSIMIGFLVQAQQGIIIKGKLVGNQLLQDTLYLTYTPDKTQKNFIILDSVIINTSDFVIKPQNILPNKYELRNKKGNFVPIYLDFGQTDIFYDGNVSQIKTSGSVVDSLLKKYDAIHTISSFSKLGYAFMSMQYKEKGEEIPDSITAKFIEDYGKVETQRKNLIQELGKRNDLVGAYVLKNSGDEFTTEELEKGFKDIPAHQHSLPFVQELADYIKLRKSIGVGAKIDNITLPQSDGTMLDLETVLKNKKLVLIDFWASWCVPCREENKNIVSIYNDFHSKGFDILGISLDTKMDDWKEAIVSDKLTWHHVSDMMGWKSEVVNQFNVKGVPHSILVDASGKIVAKNVRGNDLRTKVKEYCGE